MKHYSPGCWLNALVTLAVLVFCGSCNKLLQAWQLKHSTSDSLTVVSVRGPACRPGLQPRCQHNCTPFRRPQGRTCVLASSSSWRPLPSSKPARMSSALPPPPLSDLLFRHLRCAVVPSGPQITEDNLLILKSAMPQLSFALGHHVCSQVPRLRGGRP